MDSTHGMMLGIIEQNGNTVCRGYTDTDARQVCHHSIYPFQYHLLYLNRQLQKISCYLPHLITVRLMRHQNMVRSDCKGISQKLTVHSNMSLIITTIAIDIHLTIVTFTHSPMSGSGKRAH